MRVCLVCCCQRPHGERTKTPTTMTTTMNGGGGGVDDGNVVHALATIKSNIGFSKLKEFPLMWLPLRSSSPLFFFFIFCHFVCAVLFSQTTERKYIDSAASWRKVPGNGYTYRRSHRRSHRVVAIIKKLDANLPECTKHECESTEWTRAQLLSSLTLGAL